MRLTLCVAYKTFYTTLQSPLSCIEFNFTLIKKLFNITFLQFPPNTNKIPKIVAYQFLLNSWMLTYSWCSFHVCYAPLVCNFLYPLGFS